MNPLSWFRKEQPRNQAFSEEFWPELTFGGRETKTGLFVNWQTALQTPAALRCGMLISDGVSTVPLKLMRKMPDGKRVEAVDHPLYDLMVNKPCSWMTSQQYRETTMLRTVFAGNSFSFVNRVSSGRVMEVFPFEIGEVSVATDPVTRAPEYRVNGEVVPSERILHARGPSWDSRNGLDMVSMARETISLAQATMAAHSARFANGVDSSGVYSVDGNLTPDQHAKLTEWIKKHYTGLDNRGKPLVLDRGAKFSPSAMTGVDAEHLATRLYEDMQIATMFGVLPIMLGIADKTASYASSENMFLAHCTHTIRPWHVRIRDLYDAFLLTAQERRDGYYFHFIDTALLRGAAKDRAEYYAKLFQIGVFSPNDIRGFEDMDAYEGGGSYYCQGAMGRITANGSLEQMGQATGGQSKVDKVKAYFKNAGRVLSGTNEGLIRDASDNLITVLNKLDNEDA